MNVKDKGLSDSCCVNILQLRCYICVVWALERFQTAKVTFKVTQDSFWGWLVGI